MSTIVKPVKKHWLKGKDSCNLKILFEGRKLTEWAEHYGVSYPTIYRRYKKHGTVHPVLPRVSHNGKTAKELAEQYGLGVHVVYSRIKEGRPLDETYVKRKHGRPCIIFEGKSLSDWARHYGVTRQYISSRYKKYGTVHPNKNPSA